MKVFKTLTNPSLVCSTSTVIDKTKSKTRPTDCIDSTKIQEPKFYKAPKTVTPSVS